MSPPTAAKAIRAQFKGREFLFHLLDGAYGLQVVRDVLAGKAYPLIPFLKDVGCIVDVGANAGAASLYFACNYPEAEIVAFEPYPEAFALLGQNLATFPKIRIFPYGLLDRDCRIPLNLNKVDSVGNTISAHVANSEHRVEVALKRADSFLAALDVKQIDILKVDTEGCELPILRSLAGWLPRIRVIYVEHHNEADRIAIDAMLRGTHILFASKQNRPHLGEACYVAYHSFPSRDVLDAMRFVCPEMADPSDQGPRLPTSAGPVTIGSHGSTRLA